MRIQIFSICTYNFGSPNFDGTECFQNQIWTSKIRNQEIDLDVLIATNTTKGEAEEKEAKNKTWM